jgi:tRNA A-37 threonylcarbamoyl transferase component Bud32/biopolymer transport protein ExbD
MEQTQNPPGRRCTQCGTAIVGKTTGGLCPRCLLEMNLASRTMPGGEPSPQIPPPSPEEIAGRFPQFQIVECLGRGGMGVVYKARQKSLDRWVAIKLLAPERVHDERFAEHFEREAKTLARLSHPNIVTVFDHGEADGMFYIVMEFVDGVNLRDLLHEGKMEPAQALSIVPEICAALQFAHDHGVVHRDIKPENILIDRDGRVKIADFGIAALVGTDADHSGTPPYMAPEQESAGGTIDHRADIYALGVVLYEMLTGERPDLDPTRPSQRVEIDVRLDEIVLRALEKEPARRYQTAGEFRTIVQTIAATPVGNAAGSAAGSDTALVKLSIPAKLLALWRHRPVKVLQAIGLGLLAAFAGHLLAFGFSEGIGNELLHLPPRVNNFTLSAVEGLFSVLAIVIILISMTRMPKLAIASIGLVAFLVFCVLLPGLGDWFNTESLLVAVVVSNLCLLPAMFLSLLLKRQDESGNVASLHRLFPEPQPQLWTAVVAGAMVIALILTIGTGIKFLAEIRSATLVHVPPGPLLGESLNTPEHVARSFMEAIRDGDMDAAMAWMLPEMKQMEKLPLHLELASKILRDEIYAGQLERLTRFAEKEFTNVDGTTMLFAVRVTPPAGDQAQEEAKHGPVLILSSTPDGWRVAHIGEGRAGKSLSEHVNGFLRQSPQIRPPAAVDASGVAPRLSPRQVDLLDVDAHQGPVVLDLASGELLSVPKEVESQSGFARHFTKLGKGDLAWDGAIITLRGARLSEWLDNGWTLRNPESELDGGGAYRITVPARLRVTTAEGGHFIIDVREKIEPEKGVRIEYQRTDQPESTETTPAAKMPPEGAEIRRLVLELPVQPPLVVPKDSPLTIDQVKGILIGVTWGKLLAALAEHGKGDGIAVREIPSPGEKNNRYEIAFSYVTGMMLMELTVDWRFRSAEPSRLRPVGMPEKVLTHSSEFLPQLAIRYAMLSGHEAAAHAVEEAKAKVRQLQKQPAAAAPQPDEVKRFPPIFGELKLTESQEQAIRRWLAQQGEAANPAKLADFVKSTLRDDQQAAFQRMIEQGQQPDAPGKDVRISATPDGMWLDDRKVSHEELAEALKQLHQDTKILIQAAPSLSHKEMVAIMETCREAGMVHIAVASKTNPEKEHPDQ